MSHYYGSSFLDYFLLCLFGLNLGEKKEKEMWTELASANFIEPGVPLNVSCNAHVLGLSEDVIRIKKLEILYGSWNAMSPHQFAVLDDNSGGHGIALVPLGRRWTALFSKRETPATNESSQTSIELTLNDARCDDAGIFFCDAAYDDENKQNFTIRGYQEISNETPLRIESFNVYHKNGEDYKRFELHENVSFSCVAIGTANVQVIWLWGYKTLVPLDELSYYDSLVDDITPLYSSPCNAFRHESNLTITISEHHITSSFQCVAFYGDIRKESERIAIGQETGKVKVLQDKSVLEFMVAFSFSLLFISISFFFVRGFLRMEHVVETFAGAPPLWETPVLYENQTKVKKTPSERTRKSMRKSRPNKKKRSGE